MESLGGEAGLSRAAFADAPLGALAARTGYTSEFAFAKAFKRAHGVAPGEYRRYSRSDSLRSIAL